MDIGILFIALAVSLVINLSMFLVAFRFQSDKLTDISYAATFAALALWMFIISDHSWYHVVLLCLVVVWACRLGGFLLYRVIQKGKDSRFDDIRGDFWKFGKFWLLQAITVWVMMVPGIFAFRAPAEFGILTGLGIVIWLVGLLSESTADFQKQAFSSDASNKDKWIETGIWRYSRHPNYFGEILIWIGVYLYALPALSGLQAIIGLVSPLFIIVLLLLVSGIPILEKNADKRWGKLRTYQAYKQRTSILVPLPPKK